MNVATAMLRGVGFQPATNWVRPFMAGYTRPAMNLTSANVSQIFNQPCSEYGSIWPGENLPHESCSKSFTALPEGCFAQKIPDPFSSTRKTFSHFQTIKEQVSALLALENIRKRLMKYSC
jgi:hypothetical protein